MYNEQHNSKNNMWLITSIVVVVALIVFLVIRAKNRSQVELPTDQDAVVELAPIDSIEVELLERFPVEAQVVVHGYLPDSCSSLGSISVDRVIDTFMIVVPLERDAEAACSQVIENFERTIPLNILGLVAGTYTVDVNGLTDTFTLEIDNATSTEFDKG